MSPFFIALALTNLVVLFMLVRLPVRAYWLAKVVIIVGLASVTFLAWSAGGSGRGWPVGQALPADAQFVDCVVVEPNTSAGITGAIYVWVVPLKRQGGVLSYRPEVGEPRAYQEPYDRSLHEACEAAKKASGQGVGVGIRHVAPVGRHGRGRFLPYVLPSVALPRKKEEGR